MIQNAKDKRLSQLQSGLPDVSAAVMELLQPVKAVFMQKRQIDGYTQEIAVRIDTKASVQPLSPQALKMLPEGQRAWKYFTVFCLNNVNLKPDEVFWINGKGYRIQDKSDWSQFGYFKYTCVEDYDDAPNVTNDN